VGSGIEAAILSNYLSHPAFRNTLAFERLLKNRCPDNRSDIANSRIPAPHGHAHDKTRFWS